MTKTQLTIVAVLLALAAFLFGRAAQKNRIFQKYKCSNFLTWSEAQSAYEHGATYLDGDHDGTACENLLNQHE